MICGLGEGELENENCCDEACYVDRNGQRRLILNMPYFWRLKFIFTFCKISKKIQTFWAVGLSVIKLGCFNMTQKPIGNQCNGDPKLKNA
jgi:hypothetical protein